MAIMEIGQSTFVVGSSLLQMPSHLMYNKFNPQWPSALFLY